MQKTTSDDGVVEAVHARKLHVPPMRLSTEVKVVLGHSSTREARSAAVDCLLPRGRRNVESRLPVSSWARSSATLTTGLLDRTSPSNSVADAKSAKRFPTKDDRTRENRFARTKRAMKRIAKRRPTSE